MLKLLSGNQKGMSLVEVTVAAAVSIIIAMGVMKINETSVRGMQGIQEKSESTGVYNIINGNLLNTDKCSGSDWRGNNWTTGASDDGVYPPTASATPLAYRTQTYIDLALKSDASVLKRIEAGQDLPWSTKWSVTEVRLYNQDSADTCHVLIKTSKKGTGTNTGISAADKNLWFSMNCELDGSDEMDTCASSNAVADGYFQDNDGPSGGAITGNVPVIIGTDPGALTSHLHIGGNASRTWDAVDGTKFHATSVPTNYVMSFGDADQMGTYFDGTDLIIRGAGNVGIGTVAPGTKLAVSGDIGASGNITATATVSGATVNSSGGMTAAGTISGATVNSSGNMTATGTISAATVASSGDITAGNDVIVSNDISVGSTLSAQSVFANLTIMGAKVIGVNEVTSNNFYGGNFYGTSFLTASDKRYKKKIKSINRASEKLSEIVGVTYFMKKDEFPKMKFPKERQIGLIAQNVEKYFPELVGVNPNTGMKGVRYANFVAILVEVFKEQKIEIEQNREMLKVMEEGTASRDAEQDSRIEALERENKNLREELRAISIRLLKLESGKE